MAKGQNFTPHQKRIVDRYYEHKDTIMLDKLGQIVSDIFLCESPAKAQKLWKSAETALKQTSANPVRVAKIIADTDVQALAKLVGELS